MQTGWTILWPHFIFAVLTFLILVGIGLIVLRGRVDIQRTHVLLAEIRDLLTTRLRFQAKA